MKNKILLPLILSLSLVLLNSCGSGSSSTVPDTFDETFTLLAGGGSHFADKRPLSPPQPMVYRRNGEVVDSLPDNFYLENTY